MSKFLTAERLRTFSDSVLLVAITILAYNLVPPSIVGGQPNKIEIQMFLDNVYGLISSFFVIAFFWFLYSKILDYLKEPDDMIVLTSMVFFILVLLTPVFTLAQFQYMNIQSIASLALLEIICNILLVLLWVYLIKSRRGRNHLLLTTLLSKTENLYMYSKLAVVPCLYAISIGIAFVNIRIAVLFPIIMIPAIVLLRQAFSYNKKD